MLTAGEFVVNQAAASRNRGMLEAMNSGQQIGGGTVINLTVNGGMLGSDEEARRFIEAIDREYMRLRRDNGSLAFDTAIY
jgi:hypothetical protein